MLSHSTLCNNEAVVPLPPPWFTMFNTTANNAITTGSRITLVPSLPLHPLPSFALLLLPSLALHAHALALHSFKPYSRPHLLPYPCPYPSLPLLCPLSSPHQHARPSFCPRSCTLLSPCPRQGPCLHPHPVYILPS